MKCHKLLYKPYRKTAPYEQFIVKQREKEQQNKKQLFYQEILKFRQSRYPLQFLKQLQEQINPFELSLQKLKQLFSSKHPQYSNELVYQSVEHIFNRKCQQSQMIKQSAMVIQYGQEFIRNGRKLIKQDFSYGFDNYLGDDNAGSTSQKRNFMNTTATKQPQTPVNQPSQQHNTPSSTDRFNTDRLLTNRSQRNDSPSKIMDMMKRTERFNELLLDEIKKEKKRFENLEEIQEGSPLDSVYYYQNTWTDRSNRNNQSLLPSTFRESDLIIRADHLDTGRTQVQQLNFLLSALNFEQGQLSQQTGRSKKSKNTLRINRQIKEQLYNARGSLKLDVVRRAIDKLKRQHKQQKLETTQPKTAKR